MACCIISNLVQSLQIHLVFNKIEFKKIILLMLIVCYLVRLKYYYLGFLKNNYMLKQNWSNIKMLL